MRQFSDLKKKVLLSFPPTLSPPAEISHKLTTVLQETLELYVAGVLKGLLAFDNATAHSHTELLVRYRTSFHNYAVGMKYGSKLFKYLDRHWITTNHCETGRSPKNGVSVFLVGRSVGRSIFVRQ